MYAELGNRDSYTDFCLGKLLEIRNSTLKLQNYAKIRRPQTFPNIQYTRFSLSFFHSFTTAKYFSDYKNALSSKPFIPKAINYCIGHIVDKIKT